MRFDVRSGPLFETIQSVFPKFAQYAHMALAKLTAVHPLDRYRKQYFVNKFTITSICVCPSSPYGVISTASIPIAERWC